MHDLTLETKEKILLKLGVNAHDVMMFTGYSKAKCYEIIRLCRNEFNGRAGVLTDMITPKSLCLALGTTIEEEMRLIGIAKGYIK